MTPIDVLPDDVLLDIFDFCKDQEPYRRLVYTKIKRRIEAWRSLVHVCRRWRNIVFGSPLRLNLALVCTDKTPARDTLIIWPPLPLVIYAIWCTGYYGTDSDFKFLTDSVDNIIAVLERRDRVCEIILEDVPNSRSEDIFAAIQKPFPELTYLELSSTEEPVIPDSFLGGSAPRLRSLQLDGIPFPGLPKLPLSATHLVHLCLHSIPHSGYISPEVMATTLSTLACLEYLSLKFQSPQSFDQESRPPPPLTRSVLPALTFFVFKGVSEYLEYLVARIDGSQLNGLHITFFNQIIFDTPQLIQFVNRTPTLKVPEIAHVTLDGNAAGVYLTSVSSPKYPLKGIGVRILCGVLDWQVSSLEQICTSSLPPLSALEDLYIYRIPNWQPDTVENALWLEMLHPFPAVKNLYLCEEIAPRIMPALQELVGGRTTEVLPTLQNIFLEVLQPSGSVQEGIQQFIAARQVTIHPIAVSLWENSRQNRLPGY